MISQILCTSSIPRSAYNGNVKTPSVTVKDSAGKILKKNVDYTLSSSSGRKNVGTYKVTVKGKGDYTGSKTVTFNLTKQELSMYNAQLEEVVEPGDFKVMIGASSDDIRLEGMFTL